MEIGHDHHVPRYIYILIVIAIVAVGAYVYVFLGPSSQRAGQSAAGDVRMSVAERNMQSQIQLSREESARRQALVAAQRAQIKTVKLSTTEVKRRQATLAAQLALNKK
ncbi:hypothetical protein EB052_01295 [bacterium]|nr:hypothetical protein [bacterium]